MSEVVDLRRHGVLEAHAGTGKTYTIVGMVLRLLEEEGLSLRQILLVTFTQKAAGELLERIREGIARRAAETQDLALAAHLRDNLGQIGDAWIGTIHGVALRILRTWPFESGLPFRTELVDDADGLEHAAREVWRANPWGLLSGDLEALGEGKSVGALMDRALALAAGRLDPDMVLLPSVPGGNLECSSRRDSLSRLVSDLEVLSGSLREADAFYVTWLSPRRDALAGLDRTGFSKTLESAVGAALRGWGRVLEAGTSRKPADARGSTSTKEVADLLGKKDRDLPQALVAERILDEVVRRWTELYAAPLRRRDALETRRKEQVEGWRAALLSDWAARTAERWTRRKRVDGLLSYQDMLVGLREALRDEGFRETLRGRIRVGVVDEFQDTSALQWDIFRLWFLEGPPAAGGPRLFLVGDPKQSIYSFQGGDVRTYLRAKCELEAAGAKVHELRSNWRSAPELLRSVNALLTSRAWFGDAIAYTTTEQVREPVRQGGDPVPEAFRREPLLVARLDGPAGTRRSRYADLVAASVLAWKGQEVQLPKGDAWKPHVLDWGDFAILVQTRTSVSAFRRAFRRAGIPWALYKEQGVFASRAARELRAVLAALCEPAARNALKLRALLTRFFGVGLESLDPDVHLAGGHPDAAFLERLAHLAEGSRWSRLFQALQRESGIEQRLLREEDGDRQWMDLRQVVAHALEFLVLGQGGLPELVEHLDRLARGDLRASEDRNLHARATDRQRVQILTMHVSKGLEFPVVFLSPASRSPLRGEPRWIEERDGAPLLHMAPKEATDGALAKAQSEEELSRLLYVALTRPKLLAVLPLHRDGKGRPQDALSEILASVEERDLPGWGLLDQGRASTSGANPATEPATRTLLRIDPARLASLGIAQRVQVLSSYSAISRAQAAPGPEGRQARAEEAPQGSAGIEGVLAVRSLPEELPDAWLPRGASTGDALHELLEGLLRQSDLGWAKGTEIPAHVLDLASRALRSNGLDPSLAPRVSSLAARLLGSPMAVAGASRRVVLCDLPPEDRRPELEFHAALDERGDLRTGSGSEASGPGWLVGYIDLLFRHEGTWHVLDWKTTSLAAYEDRDLEEGMRDHDYLLQASLYAQVLARACPGRAGGAVYVFLRAAAVDLESRGPLPGIWIAEASPRDAESTRERVAAWLQARGSSPLTGETA